MSELLNATWPPEYTVKRHRRARHVKLRTSKQKGLEITVPYRFSLKELPAILAEHQQWIIKQLNQINLQKSKELELPMQINFLGTAQTWNVRYENIKGKLKLYVRPQNEIILLGDCNDKAACQRLLIKWIKVEAKKQLPALLTLLSEISQLAFSTVSVRDQKSRWGSCGSDKSINLNFRLMFLPQELVKYVIIHELCHTKYMNHSKTFWKLVAKYVPEWNAHRRLLRDADQYIPHWL